MQTERVIRHCEAVCGRIRHGVCVLTQVIWRGYIEYGSDAQIDNISETLLALGCPCTGDNAAGGRGGFDAAPFDPADCG